jgi:hypothetical protein
MDGRKGKNEKKKDYFFIKDKTNHNARTTIFEFY